MINSNRFLKKTVKLFPFIILFGIFTLSCGLSNEITNADDLITAHIEAIGGMEKLKALKSLTRYHSYEEHGVRELHRFDRKRPNLMRISTRYNRETGEFGYCEGFDGAAWEYRFNVPMRVTGMPAKALRGAAEFDKAFIDYKYKGNVVEFKGRTTLLGRDVYQLSLGEKTDYFFDAESFMLVMLRDVGPFHGEGKEEIVISIESDFRPVAGILMPYKVVQQAYPSGEIKATIIVEEIHANVEIPDEWFAPPLTEAQKQYQEFRQTALEGEIENLNSTYIEYNRLAQAQENQRWENELNILGYELLSHERFDRAIAVFKLGIKRFPDSANLYDSLGEAYMLAGETALSIENYKRSLKLNPNNNHAVEMIEKMTLKNPN